MGVCDLSVQDLPTPPHTIRTGALRSEPGLGTPHGQPTPYLLTAANHTAAEMATGLGVDHGGDILLALEVCEVQLSPFGLLSAGPRCPVTHCPIGTGLGWEDG